MEELAKIKSGDVVLPTVSKDGQPRKTLRLRCVTEADAGQKPNVSPLLPINRHSQLRNLG